MAQKPANAQSATNKTNRKPRNKITYTPAPLPAEGFVRLPSIIAVLGISRNTFPNGVKAGKYPKGTLLTSRCRVWPVTDIRALLESLSGGANG
ncbi:helix-turn-helix transcriptional regulator [Methylomonas koyamae]|uniref:helix-turn-helix transcriptional regulator n=1 Tax=Methylomonas koyamae TaxID=702114 RepID=UPI0012F6C489|nr:AlpA family phage regulatory protein [Methylomonas koyamae]